MMANKTYEEVSVTYLLTSFPSYNNFVRDTKYAHPPFPEL